MSHGAPPAAGPPPGASPATERRVSNPPAPHRPGAAGGVGGLVELNLASIGMSLTVGSPVRRPPPPSGGAPPDSAGPVAPPRSPRPIAKVSHGGESAAGGAAGKKGGVLGVGAGVGGASPAISRKGAEKGGERLKKKSSDPTLSDSVRVLLLYLGPITKVF